MDALIQRAYKQDIDTIYSKYILINSDYLSNIENDLINKKEYLPVLIRRQLLLDYTMYIKKQENMEVLGLLEETRRLQNDDAVKDLLDYLQTHKEYKGLFNQENYNKLNNELKRIEKEYNNLKLW